ncbi:MAG: hydrogenase expression/formation protein HypE, partial [Bacteroidetes bacterium]
MQLQCPLPKLDFDVITLGHGSGGQLTRTLLEKGVFSLLQNDQLDHHHDGAVLHLPGKTAFSTDSFVISPIFFPGGNIGELAVNGTVNDLAMCGAKPAWLSLGFILEEGLPVADFWEVLLGVREACRKAGVQVVTGDTKVVERGKGDQIFINTSGLGQVPPQADIGLRRVQPGDAILVSGPLAAHGVAILSVREGLQFETDILSDTRPLHQPVWDLLEALGPQVHLLRDPTRGGVAAVLNEIAQDARLGVQLEQQALPMAEQVAGACELLGLDPLYVANEGIFLTMVAEEAAEAALAVLQDHDPHAARIGSVVSEHPGRVVLRSGIGGKRVVHM